MSLFTFEKEPEKEITNIINDNIYENKLEGSKLGMELFKMVRNDEEYAKFNKYMK